MCGGARSPDYTTSQKKYQMLFAWQLEPQIGSSTPAIPTPAEVAFGNWIAWYYASSPLPTDAGPSNTNTGVLTFAGATVNGMLVTAVPAPKQ
jgi:hypothetical protein